MTRASLLLILLALPAAADERCGITHKIEAALRAKYGEQPLIRLRGPVPRSVWVNPNGGSWTILRYPDGDTACIDADGPLWEPPDVLRVDLK